MNGFQRSLGKICDHCPLCNHGRKHPETLLGRVMSWHGKYCPAWKAQQEIAAERQEEKRRDGETARGRLEVGDQKSDDRGQKF